MGAKKEIVYTIGADGSGFRKELKAAEQQQAQFNREVAKLTKEISGSNAQTKIAQLAKSVEHLGGVSKLSAPQLERVEKQIRSLAHSGATLPKEFLPIAASIHRAEQATAKTTTEMQRLEKVAAAARGDLVGAFDLTGAGALKAGAAIGVVTAGFAAASAAGRALGAIIADTLKQADRLEHLGAKTGIDTGTLQALERVAIKGETSLESLTGAHLELQKRIGEGHAVFRTLGLDLEQLAATDAKEQLFAVAEAIRRIEDPTQQATVAADAFGRSWKDLLPVIREGMEDLAAGAVGMTDAQVRAAAALENQVEDLGLAWQGFARVAAAEAISGAGGPQEGLENLAKIIRGLTKDLRDSNSELSRFVAGLAAPVTGSGRGLVGAGLGWIANRIDNGAPGSARSQAASGFRDVGSWLSDPLGTLGLMFEEGGPVKTPHTFGRNAPFMPFAATQAAGLGVDRGNQKGDRKGEAAAERLLEEQKRIVASITAGEAQKAADAWAKAIASIGGVSNIAAAQVANVRKQLVEFAMSGARLDPGLKAFMLGSVDSYSMPRTMAGSAGLYGTGALAGEGAGGIRPPWVSEADMAAAAARQVGDTYEQQQRRMHQAAQEHLDDLRRQREGTFDWAGALSTVADAFQVLGIKADSTLGRILSGLLAAGAAGQQMAEILDRNLTTRFDPRTGNWVDSIAWGDMSSRDRFGLVASGIQGIAGIYGGTQGMGRGRGALSGAMSGATMGATIGSVIPGVGTVIGAGAGALIGGIVGFFGGGKKKPVEKPEQLTLEQRFGKLLEAAEKSGTGTADSRGLLDFVRREQGSGNPIKEVKEYVRGHVDAAMQTAVALVGSWEIKTADDARHSAAAFSATFWAAVKEKGLPAAAAAFKDAFAKINAAIVEGGYDVPGFGAIARQMEIAEDPAFAKWAEVGAQMTQLLEHLGKSSYLDQDTLNAAGYVATQQVDAAKAAGASTKEALQGVMPLIVEAQRQARDYGYEIPAEIAALIEQAQAEGLRIPINLDEKRNELLREIRDGIYGIPRDTGAGGGGGGNGGGGGRGADETLVVDGPNRRSYRLDSYASGGKVDPEPGGRIIRVGEGGEAEHIVRDSEKEEFAEGVLGTSAGDSVAAASFEAFLDKVDVLTKAILSKPPDLNLTVQSTNVIQDQNLVSTGDSKARVFDFVSQEMPRLLRAHARTVREIVRQEMRTQGLV